MEQALTVSMVLSDPTRYYIYQYLSELNEEVSVLEIAKKFNIHPNVARLHLSKLEQAHMLQSQTKKTGKGGRPSRLYSLANKEIQLNFPYRDYKLLATMAMEVVQELGEQGEQILYKTGYKYGQEILETHLNSTPSDMTIENKIEKLRHISNIIGIYPRFEYVKHKNTIFFSIHNCPFKDLAQKKPELVCKMHSQLIKGMLDSLFKNIELQEGENMMEGCSSCSYKAFLW
ncbi:helix-turn-helix transcriptional regulator [Pontibacillus marinus]|uniref:Transcriptional regulator n=1 Tax=Pontibacillus marinus BH030004 = DSM 16465 TaxID=1385511 RepID=A0A0A5G1M8_9BACI|nr:helix-turn-helix domain-containing protein [Pontibacillus marinus]KGX85008.1 transcriptional regulator [Pontibacillus marinus BH030004 = DSM 16465]